MSERKKYDKTLYKIGELLSNKRKTLGPQYKNREAFIDLRSIELFGGDSWISSRYLASVELGKNLISIEKLIVLSYALEENQISLFQEIINIYQSNF